MNRRLRILAVDDDENILTIYRGVLCPPENSSVSFDVVTCRQAEEAIEAAKKAVEENNPFAVAFIDIRMHPGQTGIYAAKHIRALGSDINILITTTHSDVSPQEIARQVPPVDKLFFAQKPLQNQEILQFALALGAKWQSEKQLRQFQMELKTVIKKPTLSLEIINEELLAEIEGHKKVEEKLIIAYQTNQNILEKAPFGVYVVNSEGYIDYVNPAMSIIAGDEFEQFNKSNVFDLQTYRELGLSQKMKAGLKGEYFKMEAVEYTSYFGHKTTIRNFTGIPLQEKGERKILMIIEDITKTKKLEEALKAKTIGLEETNTALRVLLKERERDKAEFEAKVLNNVRE